MSLPNFWDFIAPSLRILDDKHWHHHRWYVSGAAEALHQAYDILQEHPLNAEAAMASAYAAYRLLQPFHCQRLCPEQHLRVEYYLALTYLRSGDDAEALKTFLLAHELAILVEDWAASILIFRSEGDLYRHSQRHAAAYQAYEYALWALDRLIPTGLPAILYYQAIFDLLLFLAARAWELGWFPVCLRHLDAAHTLRATEASVAALPLQAATLAWLDAQLARVRGRPLEAVALAQSAARLFIQLQQPQNAGRILTIAAECTLDVVAVRALTLCATPDALAGLPTTATESSERFRSVDPLLLLREARHTLQQAGQLAEETQDPAGLVMANIAQRRRVRLQTLWAPHAISSQPGLRLAETTQRTAERLHDTALYGRATVLRGDELVWQGAVAAACDAYKQALYRLEEQYLGGLATWPRHALQVTKDIDW